MRHIAKESDQLLMRSMGKTFRILAMFDNDEEANAHMASHDNMACIACFGPFVLLADKYDPGLSANQCAWSADDDGTFNGTCGVAWQFTDGGPRENEANFCPHCGGRIITGGHHENAT